MRVAAVRLSDTGSRWLTFQSPISVEAVGPIVHRPPRRVTMSRDEVMRIARAARSARSTVPDDDHQSLADEYANTDITYEALGDRYGLTRERIRQIIKEVDPTARIRRLQRQAEKDARQEQKREWGRVWAAAQRALDEDRRCRSCGGWVLRGRSFITCSPECAEAYVILRDVDDPDERRRAQALVYLARPEQYKASHVEWAHRMLSDNPPPRNRTYLVPGSERAEVIKKYRPERYAELIKEGA